MAEGIRVGIVGAGWPGLAHARGYASAGGFKVTAVADLIPARRQALLAEVGGGREFASAEELIADKQIDAVSVCLPNHLHAGVVVAALRAGKHVLCEPPPSTSAKEARQMESAAAKNGKVLLFALQRRFGGNEQAAYQAIAKGYAGKIYHARATWTRTRAVPVGTGWYQRKSESGGGAMIDLGTPMFDLAWRLMGEPWPVSVFGAIHRRLSADAAADVEHAAFALMKFDGGATLELAVAWAINQPPQQNGITCRLYGDAGAVDVYTPAGPVLYRGFNEKGTGKESPLKLPKTVGHAAMAKHFRDCIAGKATPQAGGKEAVALMQMIEAFYKSAETGKSVTV